MATDPTFLLGEYGARLDSLEKSVTRIDANVSYLVQRENDRSGRERRSQKAIATLGGVVGSIVMLLLGALKEWVLK